MPGVVDGAAAVAKFHLWRSGVGKRCLWIPSVFALGNCGCVAILNGNFASAKACTEWDAPCQLAEFIKRTGKEAEKTVNQAGKDLTNGLDRIDPRITQLGRDIDRWRLDLQSQLITGPALEQWLIRSRDDAILGALPMPDRIKRAMKEWYTDAQMAGVYYKIGDNGAFNLSAGAFTFGDAEAITLINVIVFRNAENGNNLAIWAHELMHVTQFRDWGVHSFAVQYMESYNSVENPAYAIENQYAVALANNQIVSESARPSWCDRTHLSYGDFNGDGKTDLICNSDDGKHIIAFSAGDGKFSSPGWWPSNPGVSEPSWCNRTHLSYGDFNGDGKTDLICHSDDGKHIVAFSTGDGKFSSPGYWPSNPGVSEPSWCNRTHLSYGDFNGDGKTDLICNSDDGKHIVAFSTGDGKFSSPGWWPSNPGVGEPSWCKPSQLAYGDFNGDGKTDLICNSDDGKHLVAFSKGNGTFSASPPWWPSGLGAGEPSWCNRTHLSYGDFNGDGKTDLICNSDDGKHIVAFSTGDGKFSSPGWWPSNPEVGEPSWCRPSQLAYGSFKGNGRTDLICNSGDGKQIVAFSTGDGKFSSPGWWPSNPGVGEPSWCRPSQLAYGNFKGNGRTDLICNSDDGEHIVAFSNGDGTFSSAAWWPSPPF